MNRKALLLDTHIALWLDSGDSSLQAATLATVEELRRRGGTIYFSAVSAWEIALLVDSGRLVLDVPVADWVERFAQQAGVEAVPLSPTAASAAYGFHPFPHRDPGDRLLMATAVELGCPLVTYDQRILEFGKRHGSQHRLQVFA
jgi:PIN domain nuclease of toxin-antitoxin system